MTIVKKIVFYPVIPSFSIFNFDFCCSVPKFSTTFTYSFSSSSRFSSFSEASFTFKRCFSITFLFFWLLFFNLSKNILLLFQNLPFLYFLLKIFFFLIVGCLIPLLSILSFLKIIKLSFTFSKSFFISQNVIFLDLYFSRCFLSFSIYFLFIYSCRYSSFLLKKKILKNSRNNVQKKTKKSFFTIRYNFQL